MKISSKLRDIAAVAADEFRTVSTSYSVLLVLMGGIFLYGLLYNYIDRKSTRLNSSHAR